MNSLNKVQIIGNLTANPEVRETPNGQKVATFSVATNRVWKDTAGMKQEQVEFHNIVAWRGIAGIAEQYLSKGKKVYIEGYLQTRSWDDQAGVKKYRTEIVCDSLIMLSGGAAGGDDMGDSGYSSSSDSMDSAPAAKSKKAPKIEEEIHIEDIPF
ncbi:MAG: single-stranded DNA-binding protein [Patescibacteria group bacterium]